MMRMMVRTQPRYLPTMGLSRALVAAGTCSGRVMMRRRERASRTRTSRAMGSRSTAFAMHLLRGLRVLRADSR